IDDLEDRAAGVDDVAYGGDFVADAPPVVRNDAAAVHDEIEFGRHAVRTENGMHILDRFSSLVHFDRAGRTAVRETHNGSDSRPASIECFRASPQVTRPNADDRDAGIASGGAGLIELSPPGRWSQDGVLELAGDIARGQIHGIRSFKSVPAPASGEVGGW